MNEAASGSTNWIPGLVMLAIGIVGALAYLFTQKRPADTGHAPGSVDDLNVRYNHLLGELKEHLANKHLMDPEKWVTEKSRLEQAAAQVLRERDGAKHDEVKAVARAERKAAEAAAPAAGLSPQVRTVLILAVVVGFFVFLGVNLSGATKPREEGMSATGLMPPGGGPPPGMGGGGAPMVDNGKLERLVNAARQSPEDADALGKLGIYLLRMQDFDNARSVMLQANAVDPFNVKSRIGHAVLKALDGDMKGASNDLEHLAAYYPEAYDAHYFEGLIANEGGDAKKALTELEAYVSYAPEEEVPPMLSVAITELRQQVRPGQ